MTSITETIIEKEYSYEEVSKHNSFDDCWIIIHGKVYDVTKFISKHPGGELIIQGAGRDATPMFESSHPEFVKEKVLPKYHIGSVKNYKSFYTWDSEFYRVLKKRVFNYFKERNISHHGNSEYWLKVCFTLICFPIFYYLGLICGSVFFTLIAGLFGAQFGIGIMHDGNHGATSKNSFINAICASTMDFVGGSSFIWKHEHNIGHHQFTNMPEDPDVDTGEPFIRFSPNQKYLSHYKYQHIYIWFVYSIVTHKWYFSDIIDIIRGKYARLELYKPNLVEMIVVTIGKISVICWALFVPIYFNGFITGFSLWFLFWVIMSFCFTLQFAPTHINTEVLFPTEIEIQPKLDSNERDWAKLQILTACNYSIDSTMTSLYSGGLNFQIEHHLLPTISHVHYRHISPIVRQTCKEFGVPYISFPTYFHALAHHYKHLKKLGDPSTAPVYQKLL
eukprot:TRINITY_DN1721_c0_g1_i1.p1 TRINITY_DN1721_c0_g1~~TRINITY_DN1721_c0_g1_i1.p1  ORF type:complete len:447 (+),score=162.68 TRINITY_DN1721_c0_g1_i1:104-1444(+)